MRASSSFPLSFSRGLVAGSLLVGSLAMAAAPARAHNAGVHRDMTDRAYHILIALSKDQLHTDQDAEMAELAQAADKAIPKLQGLPAGLPPPKQSVCADPAVIQKVGTSSPSWGAPADFKQMTLGAVPFPVSTAYISGNDCGIDSGWSPGAFFENINPATGPGGRDLTGVVLGFWAQHPDDERDDWHIYFRPTNMAGMSAMKDYIETALGAAPGTVWVTVRCFLDCIGDFLGLGGDCEECVDEAIAEAQSVVHEGVSTIDGLVPGFGDHTSLDYTGMGHHLNVAPPGPAAPWKLDPAAADNHPGLLVENAGPVGIPDTIEFISMLAADVAGMSVHYEPSLGPKRYEVLGAQDFHPDSVDRDEDDWQFLSFPHTVFTPLDNLAFHGWKAFRDEPKANVPSLGWPLHAFGDAIVPMHVTGTFGWGHRPYEDAFQNLLSEYLNRGDREDAHNQAVRIARRAVVWRKFIRDWRAAHPERGMDIPVREMVTRLALQTFDQVQGAGMFNWPFNPAMSTAYVIPGPGKEGSIAFYETAAGSLTVNPGLFEEGIAAQVAFLVSAAEVLP